MLIIQQQTNIPLLQLAEMNLLNYILIYISELKILRTKEYLREMRGRTTHMNYGLNLVMLMKGDRNILCC